MKKQTKKKKTKTEQLIDTINYCVDMGLVERREEHQELMRETRKANELKERELAQRDRVDISLKEYEALKLKATTFETEAKRLHELFERIGIQRFMLDRMVGSTIETRVMQDPATLRNLVHIRFEVRDTKF